MRAGVLFVLRQHRPAPPGQLGPSRAHPIGTADRLEAPMMAKHRAPHRSVRRLRGARRPSAEILALLNEQQHGLSSPVNADSNSGTKKLRGAETREMTRYIIANAMTGQPMFPGRRAGLSS
jgi:hypothetical protein